MRLKDIRDLFMNTGLGKSGYSIIGQGRVDEIISEKSEDRRGIFEEAAGIAKYRVRKTEAEKKLAETEDNLSRVSDILSELEGRVEPLQKEAEKARKYLSLYEEKKKADVGLWLYEIDGILSESEKLREDYEIAKHSLEMTDDSLNALSGRNEKLSESLHESRRNEEEAERLLSEHTERLHETESSEKLFLRDIAHLQEEMERLRRERAQKKEEEKKAENALAECEARRREAISCAESVESALHDAEGRLEEKRTALRLLGERLEELRGEAAALGEQILQKQLALSSLEGRDNSDEGRREELTAELAEISRRISATKEALREGEDTAAAYTERADGLRKKEDALLAEEEAIGEKVSACKAAIEKESSAKSGNFSRMEALRRMEEHFEGYANSVRFVMDMAEKGRLRGIRGPVSRLLSVDARYTVAIETALGGNLQNILVEDEAAAKAAIRCLAEHKAGRTTFYPLAVMRPERLFADPAKLSRMRGYVGIASELCRFDEHDRPVMEYLLCRTVVCEDLDSAGEIARSFGYKFRIVTLDGQIINAGGSFTGGSAKRDSGMLSRRAEIERLQREIKRSEDTVGEKKKALMQLEKDAEALRGKREQLESEREILGVMRGAEDAEQKVRKATLLGDEEQLARTKEALAALNEKSENRTRSMEAARAALAALQAEEEKQKALLSEENERLLSGQTALTALVEEKNALLLKKTVSMRDREFAERELSAANEALAAAITGGKSFEEAIAKAESREQSVKTTVESTRRRAIRPEGTDR